MNEEDFDAAEIAFYSALYPAFADQIEQRDKNKEVTTVDEDLKKYSELSSALFHHVYTMGFQTSYGRKDRAVTKEELQKALDESYLNTTWAKDVADKRENFLELCWCIASWGNWDGNK